MRIFHVQSENADNKGFTLIETLVAITILLLVIMGPISIAARGLKMATHAGDELTATFLAQEGLEAIIKYRDEQALAVLGGDNDPTWDWIENNSAEPFQSCGAANDSQYNNVSLDRNRPEDQAQSCNTILDSGGSVTFTRCNADTRFCGLSYNTDLGRYESVQMRNGKFKRYIIVRGETDALRIKVMVRWSSGLFGGNRSVILETWLYDHYNRFSD